MRKLPKFVWLKNLITHDGASYSPNVYLTPDGEKYIVAYGKRSVFYTEVDEKHDYHDKDCIKRITEKEGYPEEFLKLWKQYDKNIEKLYKQKSTTI